MPERIPAIQQALADTEAALKELTGQVDFDEATLRRTKNTARVALFGLILDITLTVFVGWGLVGVNHDQTRINELQASVQAEADHSRLAQCAIITLFLQFEPKSLANPNYTAEQRALQVQAYQTLRQIGDNLGCVNK